MLKISQVYAELGQEHGDLYMRFIHEMSNVIGACVKIIDSEVDGVYDTIWNLPFETLWYLVMCDVKGFNKEEREYLANNMLDCQYKYKNSMRSRGGLERDTLRIAPNYCFYWGLNYYSDSTDYFIVHENILFFIGESGKLLMSDIGDSISDFPEFKFPLTERLDFPGLFVSSADALAYGIMVVPCKKLLLVGDKYFGTLRIYDMKEVTEPRYKRLLLLN